MSYEFREKDYSYDKVRKLIKEFVEDLYLIINDNKFQEIELIIEKWEEKLK